MEGCMLPREVGNDRSCSWVQQEGRLAAEGSTTGPKSRPLGTRGPLLLPGWPARVHSRWQLLRARAPRSQPCSLNKVELMDACTRSGGQAEIVG